LRTLYYITIFFFIKNYQSQELPNYNQISKNTFGLSITNSSFNGDLETLTKENIFLSTRFIYGLNYERTINHHFSLLSNISWGKLSSNNSFGNFESSIFQTSIENVFYFNKIYNNENKFSPYLSLGLGLLRFNSYTDILDENGFSYNYWDDGSIRDIPQSDSLTSAYLSRDYNYETKLENDSINYSNYSLFFPVSVGLLWKFKNLFNVKLFTTFNQLLTDWIDNISDGQNDQYFSLGFSINFFFSREEINFKKEKKQYLNIFDLIDSDLDGVIDHDDKCQKTPSNVVILKNGCPLDSDFDGVYDYKDLEPYSKAMLYVDEFGRSIKNISIKNSNVQFDTIIVKEVKNFIE